MTSEVSVIKSFAISGGGLSGTILDMGAAIMDLSVDMPGGARPVILRHGTAQAYAGNPHYLGAIAGRCANRIRGGSCEIDGRPYQLDRNENGITHLHGGSLGFSRKLWTLKAHTGNAVELALHSPDGEQGYPGNLEASCLYEILAGKGLRITLRARSDATTLVNLAAHSYFNLEPGTSILDHALQVNAPSYTPVDQALIPDGRILPVRGTCFDFAEATAIGVRCDQSPIGYDHNLVLAGAPRDQVEFAAKLISPSGDLSMELWTTEPGLQFYDGRKLGPDPGDPLSKLRPFAGCCLEPQRFPDAIHHRNFASAILLAGEEYRQITEHRFHS